MSCSSLETKLPFAEHVIACSIRKYVSKSFRGRIEKKKIGHVFRSNSSELAQLDHVQIW